MDGDKVNNIGDLVKNYKKQRQGCKRLLNKSCNNNDCENCFGKACTLSNAGRPTMSLCYSSSFGFQANKDKYSVYHDWICCITCAKFDFCKDICPYIDVENQTIKHYWG
jgi:hypothetical protein